MEKCVFLVDFCQSYGKKQTFFEKSAGNIWLVSGKSVPLHSLLRTSTTAKFSELKKKAFFETLREEREVVQEARMSNHPQGNTAKPSPTIEWVT